MVEPFFFSFRFWIALIPLMVCGLFLVLAHLSRFRHPATFQVCDFLRGTNLRRLSSNLLTQGWGVSRFARTRAERRDALDCDLLRLHEARNFLLAVFHDMGILIAWSKGALYMELVGRPWERDGEVEDPARSEQFVAGHRALLAAARNFRRHALVSILRVNVALLFHAHWRLQGLMPAWSSLSRTYVRFLAIYASFFKALVEVTPLYDEGLAEDFLQALFKIEDPATEVMIWRKAGIILSAPAAT